MRIFTDTNVLASAFGTRGLCADLLEIVIEQHELVVSESVLTELERVLLRKFHVPVADCRSIDSYLRSFEIVPDVRSPGASGISDEADAIIFGSAVEAGCDIFVTGDRELLYRVRREKPIKTLDPRECWRELRRARGGRSRR